MQTHVLSRRPQTRRRVAVVRHVDDNRVAVQAVDMRTLVTLPTEFRSQGARMIIGIRTPASQLVIFLSARLLLALLEECNSDARHDHAAYAHVS